MIQPFLLVIAPYYTHISAMLVEGARGYLQQKNAAVEMIEVPGALEIPAAIALAARSGKYAGYVALGCVIRGETTHYETVCNESARGLMDLSLQGLAIGNGILTVENEQQAITRADPSQGNKGADAAAAALCLAALTNQFQGTS
jgi:6,7-dimethyl-8-ribityllumazine synthase